MINGIFITPKDGVVTISAEAKPGDVVSYLDGKDRIEVTALDIIPIYHKMAIKPIAKGEKIIKYGELIGIAACDIKVGQHVHVHNVAEPERG